MPLALLIFWLVVGQATWWFALYLRGDPPVEHRISHHLLHAAFVGCGVFSLILVIILWMVYGEGTQLNE